jgi:DNA-binding transcriptional regulator PaaX
MHASRSVLIGILVLTERGLTAAQLIELAAPLGVSASNVKSHLTRMVAEGVLEREGPVRRATYRPAPRQAFVIESILQSLQRTEEPWDGTWWMFVPAPQKSRSAREHLRVTLSFAGWRAVGSDVLVRPAWGLAVENLPGLLMRGHFVSEGIDPSRLYDLDRLDSAARSLAARIERQTTRPTSPKAAFVARMKIGGRVAQFIGHDPHLPPAIWGQRSGMQQVGESFRRFEERTAPEAEKFVNEVLAR